MVRNTAKRSPAALAHLCSVVMLPVLRASRLGCASIAVHNQVRVSYRAPTGCQRSRTSMPNDNTQKPAAFRRDQPWLIRTYSGHSSAQASNALYRTNLARGQTGLSVAFDLPTQTGYDADHPLAKGEVGKVGVPIGHLADMEALFAGIPLARMNTSMTINAPAPWLLALYIAAAERQGASRKALAGTEQNDIVKEYLSRGNPIFPHGPSLRR